jgi:hypothetical protein
MSAIHARKTHCIRGHQFDSERRSKTDKPWRVCSTCAKLREKQRGTRPTTSKPKEKPA